MVSRLGTYHTVQLRPSLVPSARTSVRGASAPSAGDTHTPSLSRSCQRPSPHQPHRPRGAAGVSPKWEHELDLATWRGTSPQASHSAPLPGPRAGPAWGLRVVWQHVPRGRAMRGCSPRSLHFSALPESATIPFPVAVFGKPQPRHSMPCELLCLFLSSLFATVNTPRCSLQRARAGARPWPCHPRGTRPGPCRVVFWNWQAEV